MSTKGLIRIEKRASPRTRPHRHEARTALVHEAADAARQRLKAAVPDALPQRQDERCRSGRRTVSRAGARISLAGGQQAVPVRQQASRRRQRHPRSRSLLDPPGSAGPEDGRQPRPSTRTRRSGPAPARTLAIAVLRHPLRPTKAREKDDDSRATPGAAIRRTRRGDESRPDARSGKTLAARAQKRTAQCTAPRPRSKTPGRSAPPRRSSRQDRHGRARRRARNVRAVRDVDGRRPARPGCGCEHDGRQQVAPNRTARSPLRAARCRGSASRTRAPGALERRRQTKAGAGTTGASCRAEGPPETWEKNGRRENRC
jgi:hypothetical protein